MKKLKVSEVNFRKLPDMLKLVEKEKDRAKKDLRNYCIDKLIESYYDWNVDENIPLWANERDIRFRAIAELIKLIEE